MDSRQPSVLMVAAKWWSLSARLAISLVHHRCRVSALCPAGHPLTKVSGIDRVHRYGGIYSLNCLRRTLYDVRPDIIIPCDEGVVAQLHALHRQEPLLKEMIERSLGAPESYSIVSSRYALLSTAKELGIAVPRTVQVRGTEDLVAWHSEVSASGVLKVAGESGGRGVRICGSLDESLAAWSELSMRGSSATAWKRLAIDRDPLSRWMHRTETTREITIQDFIRGRPANSMLACHSGRVLAIVSVAVIAADGPTGAAIIVQRVRDERLANVAQQLVKRLQVTGFVGLDFVIEDGTGTPYLIEMNPRCTQLGHLEFLDQGGLAGIFVAALRGESRPPAENPILLDKIALFPLAIAAHGAHSRHVGVSYLDVPWDEPQLVRELKLAPWPQRRWIARLYHAFRALQRSASVEFENVESSLGASESLHDTAEKMVRAAQR